jgi:hypothetical protein
MMSITAITPCCRIGGNQPQLHPVVGVCVAPIADMISAKAKKELVHLPGAKKLSFSEEYHNGL